MASIKPGELRRDDLLRRTLDEDMVQIRGYQHMIQLQEVNNVQAARCWWEVVETSPALPPDGSRWAYDNRYEAERKYIEVRTIRRSMTTGAYDHSPGPKREPPTDAYGGW